MTEQTFAIIGAGAVGTVLAGALSQKNNTYFIVRDARLTEHKACKNIIVTGHKQLTIKQPSLAGYTNAQPSTERFFVCVKHSGLEALTALFEQLPARSKITLCLNGVGAAAALQQRFPQHHFDTLTIVYNAQLLGTQQAQLTTKPEVIYQGEDKTLITTLNNAGLNAKFGSEADSWGKLLINLNNAIGALCHSNFKDVFTDKNLRRIYVATIDEAVAVLNQANIKFSLPVPLPYSIYRLFLLYGGQLPWLVAKHKNGITEHSFPSMLADVKAQRLTEVRQIVGVIESLGKQYNVATPLNSQFIQLVEKQATDKEPLFLSAAQLKTKLSV